MQGKAKDHAYPCTGGGERSTLRYRRKDEHVTRDETMPIVRTFFSQSICDLCGQVNVQNLSHVFFRK